ncbi:hypothetical protein GCM10010909_15840 [Acidocella aquatica]|uniref:Uncharacterized protein n=1 Tax=Acidocella aquatica TaxID=1922313 RepID=A0ABQ6A417_9PROT|nr:hypothetical protein [Acidocella aquatica]GLR66904.1 hypothetical protein GCM10010909_15840 [Acidocella aquatica]
MADYRSPTVVQQMIPVSDMTSLEHLLLTNIFDAEPHEDKLYLSTYESPASLIWVSRAELEVALAAPENAIYKKVADFTEDLQKSPASETSVMLDVSMMSWEVMLQNVIKRSETLKYISAVTSYTCSKMRLDGWGGYVVLITAGMISGKGTDDILGEMLEDAGIEDE